LSFARGDQASQAFLNKAGPAVPTPIVTLIAGYQANLGKNQLCFVSLCGNFKNNFIADPFSLVFYGFKVIVFDQPNDFLIWNHFNDFYFGAVVVFKTVCPFRIEFGGIALNVLAPPQTGVVNSFKNFGW
jgi:hypothetical protein